MLLKAINISKTFDETSENKITILQNINLELFSKDFLFIEGPSGSGKSTLLQILGLMDIPTDGQLEIAGQPVDFRNQTGLSQLRAQFVGFVFQKSLMLSDLTVEENLILALKASQLPVLMPDIASMLEKVNLTPKKSFYLRHLSVGELQRAALAVALVKKPKLLIADEPIASLDERNKSIVLSLIADLTKELNTGVILASHDPVVKSYATTCYKLSNGTLTS